MELDTIQYFLCELGMKQPIHLVEIIIFHDIKQRDLDVLEGILKMRIFIFFDTFYLFFQYVTEKILKKFHC